MRVGVVNRETTRAADSQRQVRLETYHGFLRKFCELRRSI